MCYTAIDTRASDFESLAVIDHGAWEAVRNIARNNTTDVWWPVRLDSASQEGRRNVTNGYEIQSPTLCNLLQYAIRQ